VIPCNLQTVINIWNFLLPPPSEFKKEAAGTSNIMVVVYQTTWHQRTVILKCSDHAEKDCRQEEAK
jgi:hypothetical protein